MASIPESAWVLTRGVAFDACRRCATRSLSTRGTPPPGDGEALAPVALIEAVEKAAQGYGIGRGIHLGETILGIKGRAEAPAAEVLLAAHRELEKLVLTGRQVRVKDGRVRLRRSGPRGAGTDPVCRDIEASSSQQRVTGEVHLLFRPGSVFVEGVASPFSLRAALRGVYGEAAGEWSAADARGFSRSWRCRGSSTPARQGAAGEGDVMKTVLLDKIARSPAPAASSARCG